jgi:autotransporter-associated beta strand protein
VKSGAGTWTLNAANTYGGTTTINAGTLKIDNNNTTTARLINTSGITVNSGGTLLLAQSGVTASTDRINDAATVTLNGGTFDTGGLSEGTHAAAGIGALTLSNNSIIDLGNGASILHFAASNAVSWTASKILTIEDWSGSVAGNGTDQLLFGTTSSGLTASQISEVRFLNPLGFAPGTYDAAILSTGELVPIPEPGTWLAGALALGSLLATQRRHVARLLKQRA